MKKEWVLAETVPNDVCSSFTELSPALLQCLWNRGVRTRKAMTEFLEPDWSRDVYDPQRFRQMSRAVHRVFAALEARAVITVHGDYDADGVCGSAALFSTLRDICRALSYDETKLLVYLPHREKEGYGFSVSTAEHLHAHERTNLVVTVDCGIGNREAIARAKELGMDTIVCDHHAMPAALPEDTILLHPLVPGETYPNAFLCGTGVAFKLASALIHEARRRGAAFPEGYEKWLLDLVAIATVTDVMPLTGENRALERYGLLVLQKTRRIGLKKLFAVAGVTPEHINTWTIGFQIGPRLNAAGRMRHASGAFRALICEDEVEAIELARELHAANAARQRASEEMYRAAREQIGDPGDRALLTAVGDGWSAGLVGLVAGKLANELGRPVLVGGYDGEKIVGSGRSIPAFNIMHALAAASEHLDRFGGHPQACGFSTNGRERFARAVERMTVVAEEELKQTSRSPILHLDAVFSLRDINVELSETLARLEPFGEGNPEPVFFLPHLTVAGVDTVGVDGKHGRVLVRSATDGVTRRMIGFGLGARVRSLRPGVTIDTAVSLGMNEWNGNRELQIKLIDFRVAE
jgi:single-stranded-DNA-specific exonuclease